ncbi:MAG TPA: AlkA N-terminal domain-containing protein [Propionibacteriaceae bacterium]
MSLPFDGVVLFRFLSRWAVPGVERCDTDGEGQPRYARALRLTHGPGLVRLTWTGSDLVVELQAAGADQAEALAKIGSLCDLACDPEVVDEHLGRDPHLSDMIAVAPGLRIPGTTDPHELAFQVLIGQQISMAAAVTCAAKITKSYGEELETPGFGLTSLFPTAQALAEVDPTLLPMPRARGRALVSLARALASGVVDLSGSESLAQMRSSLLAQPGIGPWTADGIAMRALGDRDVLLTTDLVIKRELVARGVTDASAWSPFRSYVTVHLWRPYVL